MTNDEPIDQLKQMHTALISDVTDEMGITENVLDPGIRPIWGKETIVGTAHTIQNVPIAYEMDEWEEHAAEHLDAIEAISPGDVVVHTAPECVTAGLWGELLSAAASVRDSVGTVIDGYVRDARLIEDQQYPVWAKGSTPADAYGRCLVKEYDVSVEAGGVTIDPDDIIVADYEGVVNIPSDALDEVVDRATELQESEGNIRRKLRNHESIWDVVSDHGEL